jgi:hypothetical protein
VKSMAIMNGRHKAPGGQQASEAEADAGPETS